MLVGQPARNRKANHETPQTWHSVWNIADPLELR